MSFRLNRTCTWTIIVYYGDGAQLQEAHDDRCEKAKNKQELHVMLVEWWES